MRGVTLGDCSRVSFLTSEQSYISVFGVIRASGHTADSVSNHLQRVSLLDNTTTQANPQQSHEDEKQRGIAIKKC